MDSLIKKIASSALLTGILVLMMAGLISCENNLAGDLKPNIVLVFADDMGYGDLACFGNPLIKTPILDNLADEGIRLTSFYVAASVCTPSRAALLTGRYPIRNLPNNIGPETVGGLPLDELTIADILGKEGYTSMAIGKWHLGYQAEYLPVSRGFDKFYGLPYSNDMILPWCPWLNENDRLFLYSDTTRIEEIGYNQENLTVMYTGKALEFIEENKEGPFFLYLAHSMPHLPISTAQEFRGKSPAGLYGDVIQTIDWSMGEILRCLEDNGIADKTMVIFTSDNGPWHDLPDRMLQNGVERWHTGSTGPFRGAKDTTYEGGFRVPAIIRWPGVIPAGRETEGIVSTMDLFTTILEAAGASLPADRKVDGMNVMPFLINGEGPTREEFFYLSGKTLQAVRKGEWKLRITREDSVQLFNLMLDQSEKYNRAEELPELVEQLYKEMQLFSEETGAILNQLNNQTD